MDMDVKRHCFHERQLIWPRIASCLLCACFVRSRGPLRILWYRMDVMEMRTPYETRVLHCMGTIGYVCISSQVAPHMGVCGEDQRKYWGRRLHFQPHSQPRSLQDPRLLKSSPGALGHGHRTPNSHLQSPSTTPNQFTRGTNA